MAMPDIRSEKREGNVATCVLFAPATLVHFRDHFPRYPILPGVVQLDWAVRFARRHFAGLAESQRFDNFKCRAPVSPDTELTLVLAHDPARNSVQFQYTARGRAVCTGTLLFQ